MSQEVSHTELLVEISRESFLRYQQINYIKKLMKFFRKMNEGEERKCLLKQRNIHSPVEGNQTGNAWSCALRLSA